eukprot:TRINITY_DN403_c0_g1_i2.p3 TRINITY_DN403_c0_g1~~TRINITY_DN403_c0_g1_i2.p3  ORF type:complete len:138 (-),score=44.68 TRINITY_DN403_c0_g1_i2:231-644(-)
MQQQAQRKVQQQQQQQQILLRQQQQQQQLMAQQSQRQQFLLQQQQQHQLMGQQQSQLLPQQQNQFVPTITETSPELEAMDADSSSLFDFNDDTSDTASGMFVFTPTTTMITSTFTDADFGDMEEDLAPDDLFKNYFS